MIEERAEAFSDVVFGSGRARARARARTVDRRFTTGRFDGQDASGRWTLEIHYRGTGSKTGTLQRWALQAAADE